MSTPNPGYGPPEPRTRVRRSLIRTLMIAAGSVIVVLLFIHYFSHKHETAAQRQQQALIQQAVTSPTGQPDALGSALTAQQDRAKAQAALLSPASATAAAPPPASSPLPQGYGTAGIPQGTPGATTGDEHLSDADRLALQRGSDATDGQTLMVYEARDGAAPGSASAGGSADSAIDTLQKSLNEQVQQLKNTTAHPASGNTDSGTAIDGNAGGLLPAAYTAALGGANAAGNPGSANAQRQAKWLGNPGQDSQHGPLTPVAADSPYTLGEGEPIPTVIEQNQKSDIPGTIRAIVDRDVYDSINGTCNLIPKGTKLKGLTNSDVAIGQERMLIAMTRMTFGTTGAHLDLGSMGGADPDGTAGLTADVDNHFFKIFGSTFLIGGVASWIGSRQNSGNNGGTSINVNGGSSSSALSQAGAQALTQTTQTLLQRNMNIQPTLSLAPGQRMTIVTTRDMVLPPEMTGGRCY